MPINAQQITPWQRWLIIIAVMSATLMQVLDTTIVNVALPYMQGSLGANSDEISWTLTSYLVASAIFMPLTGYFTDRFGRKNYLLICIAGFTFASALCGASLSLSAIVFFRLLQGVFGAALVPLSQAILVDVYSTEERGKAMAIWGLGVMIGPVLGPTLGGYLTDIASWRWTFYVNVPVGIFAVLLAWSVVPDTVKIKRSMDWIGLVFISCAIGALQYFLDRGNQQDWLDALDIRIAVIIAIVGLCSFLIHSFKHPQHTVFNLKIFKDRNFTISSLILALLGLGMYGSMVIQPLLLESLLNYPVLTAGLILAPRGISAMVGMVVVGKLINRYDPRWLIITGIILSSIGTSAGMKYNQLIDMWWIAWPLLFQGFGLSLIFVPLSTIAFSTLPAESRSEATGLYSLLRTIGASVGISLTITVFTRHTQIAWNQIGGSIQPYNQALYDYLRPLHLSIHQPLATTILSNELIHQAQMIAFLDSFTFITGGFLLMLPLVFLLKKVKNPSIKTEIISD